MAKELAFILINPYTIAKSRTGGVIARIIARTDLDFVAARMIGPSQELVDSFVELLGRGQDDATTRQLLGSYVKTAYAPDRESGRPKRVMLLLFEGENAVEKICKVTGSATSSWSSGSGQTIRDTYGDYITDPITGQVVYFEPAVLMAPRIDEAAETLKLWARHSGASGGILESGIDVPAGKDVEKTLVLIKPDNFRFPSTRPGNIIDMLSSSALRIVAVKKFCMTVAQAEEFYGPVKEVLSSKFEKIGAKRVGECLRKEFDFVLPDELVKVLCRNMADVFAESQFESIVKFMTGHKPSEVASDARATTGSVGCLGLMYEGVGAVKKIRTILGSTDPNEAVPGSIRREYGSNIMVNAAHASDSSANAEREVGIVDMVTDTIRPMVEKYYGAV